MESNVTLKNLNRDNAYEFFNNLYKSFKDTFNIFDSDYDESLVYGLHRTLDYNIQDMAYYTLCYMGFRESEKNLEMVSYFEFPEKRKKGIRYEMKPGRFLRKYFPWLSNSTIEDYVNFWKDATRVRDYELIYSKEESAFIEAYAGEQIRGTNPDYKLSDDFVICSLSDSCMGNEKFSDLPKHPASTYASGDFSVLYAKEKESGKIGARMVIGRDSGKRLYSQCNSASKLMLSWLAENNIKSKSNWTGLTLQATPCKYGYLMPYVDGYDSFDFDFDGDSITIGGNFGHTSTQGYIEFIEPYSCEECESGVFDSEYLEQALDRNEDTICICRHCRARYYSYSDLQEIWIHHSIAYTVDNTVATKNWLDSNGYVYTVNGEYEKESECLLFNGYWFPHYHHEVILFGGNYYYEYSDELIEAKAKEGKAYETKVTHSFNWVRQEFGSWDERTPHLEYKETTERTLRLNYQLDSNGIPQRLPELDLGLVDITSDNCE